nr:hypothetical protein [uncultured Niameybacter sp.]
MRKYTRLQILKHALEYYMERPGATSAKRKAFSQYKQLDKHIKYQQFMKDTKLDEIFLEDE